MRHVRISCSSKSITCCRVALPVWLIWPTALPTSYAIKNNDIMNARHRNMDMT